MMKKIINKKNLLILFIFYNKKCANDFCVIQFNIFYKNNKIIHFASKMNKINNALKNTQNDDSNKKQNNKFENIIYILFNSYKIEKIFIKQTKI